MKFLIKRSINIENKYIELVKAFKEMDIEDKKEDVMKQSLELLKLLYYINKKINKYNEVLPILSEYNNEDEYFDNLFTIIISLKEENAKLLDNLNI